MTDPSTTVLHNDARYQAALRHCANVGQGFTVSPKRRGSFAGHLLAALIGIGIAAAAIGFGL